MLVAQQQNQLYADYNGNPLEPGFYLLKHGSLDVDDNPFFVHTRAGKWYANRLNTVSFQIFPNNSEIFEVTTAEKFRKISPTDINDYTRNLEDKLNFIKEKRK